MLLAVAALFELLRIRLNNRELIVKVIQNYGK